jgi:hypothetical protein
MPGAPRFAIGTRFVPCNDANKCVYTVVDIWQTFNTAGECVRVEYLSENSFCGQLITSRDCDVARGIANMAEMKVSK